MKVVKAIATALLLMIVGFIVGARYREITTDLQTGTPTVYEGLVSSDFKKERVRTETVDIPEMPVEEVASTPEPASSSTPEPEPEPIVEEEPEEEPEPQVWREDVPLSMELQNALLNICEEEGVDPLLVLGLIYTESGFQVDAVSPWGDYGLCQLNKLYFPTDVTPEENMKMGIGLLASNIRKYGTVEAALTAYNRGYDDGTRGYASEVLANAAKYGYQQ